MNNILITNHTNYNTNPILTQSIIDQFIFNLINLKYKNKIKSLSLSITNTPNNIQLNSFLIKKSLHNKEYDYAVINDICKFADLHNVQISLCIDNLNNNQIKNLYIYYSKFGFVLIKNNNDQSKKIIYFPNK